MGKRQGEGVDKRATAVDRAKALAALIPSKKKPRGKPFAKGGDDPRIAKHRYFQPGNNVNPGGRPKTHKELKKLCQEITFDMTHELAARGPLGAIEPGQVEFLKTMKDEGFGKVPVKLQHGGVNDEPIKFDVTKYSAEELEQMRVLRLKGKVGE